MTATSTQSVDGLLAMNIALAIFCAGAVLAVATAAFLDWRERCRRKALVPPCWPPPGVDPAEAYATDLEEVSR